MKPRSETMAAARQKIINAGSHGIPCRELATSMGITWNTLKTIIYKLGKAGFAVAYRRRGGVALYFMEQMAPASTGDGSIRPKSTRTTCEQHILKMLEQAPRDGLTYDQVRGTWQKSSVAIAVQNLKSAGKLAVGKWASGKGQATGRIFSTAEQRDAAFRREMERRTSEKSARRAQVKQSEKERHAKRRREAQERRAARADALAVGKRRERLAKVDNIGRPQRAEPAPTVLQGPVIVPPGVKVQVIKSQEDTRFKVDPRDASMFFSALGPGQYIRSDNAIARAYGSGK